MVARRSSLLVPPRVLVRSRVPSRPPSRVPWLLAVLVLAVLALAGCGVAEDNRPRDVAPDDRQPLSNEAADLPAVGGTRSPKVFFQAAPGSPDENRLQAVARDVPDAPAAVLAELLKGLTPQEQAQRLRTAIPAGTQLRSTSLRPDGTLVVDLSDAFFQAISDNQVIAVAQIVITATDLGNVSAVRLLVEGEAREWPRGDGVLQSEPLTQFDYPLLNPSSQPPYPPLPAPAAASPSTSSG